MTVRLCKIVIIFHLIKLKFFMRPGNFTHSGAVLIIFLMLWVLYCYEFYTVINAYTSIIMKLIGKALPSNLSLKVSNIKLCKKSYKWKMKILILNLKNKIWRSCNKFPYTVIRCVLNIHDATMTMCDDKSVPT